MTRAQLLALVLDGIDRPDLNDTNPATVASWVARAEQRIQRELRCREMVKRSTIPLTSQFVTLPNDFLAADILTLINAASGLRVRALEYISPQDLANATQPMSILSPMRFTDIGGQLELFPAVGFLNAGVPAYTLEMAYFAKLPALVNDTDTNWLLETKFDIYYNAILSLALMFTQEPDRSQMHDGMVTTDIAIMNASSEIAVERSSRLVARSRNPIGTGTNYRR